jgi:hypothetical protein
MSDEERIIEILISAGLVTEQQVDAARALIPSTENDISIEVQSFTRRGVCYEVKRTAGQWSCDCMAFQNHPDKDCKHILSTKRKKQ